jgi:spermidine/putrescine transport system permease protein
VSVVLPSGVPASPEGSDAPGWLKGLAAVPVVLWVGVLVIAPNITLFLYGVWTNKIATVERTFTLSNFEQALGSEVVRILILRSVLIALVTATCATLIGYPVAYGIARYFRKYRLIATLLVVVPLWVSFLMRIFAWKIILGEHGVLNELLVRSSILNEPSRAFLYSPITVVIAMTYVGIPYVFLSTFTALERIPPNLYEASGDCGASNWRTFWQVVWPISRPAVMVGFALVFIVTFGDYVTPTLVGGFSGTMIGSMILQAFGALNNWPLGAALAVIMLVITLAFLGVLSLFMRKRVVLED